MIMQYYFDTLFPRIPVPVVRQIVANLEKLKLPAKHAGVTGESSRQGSDDVARRPPSVKAALSVSFGQRAPHRASTRDSSPVRRTVGSAPERDSDHQSKPFIEENKDKTKVVSSNLIKLKDLYGDASERKSEEPADRLRKDTSSEEVIRLGGFTWK
ncbi:hypothetical protein ZIOFF_029769 [Zingiber officinale]|uniref:Uncharacterized protein n=1 Tax=Zingiber officinale TaxID=94328 RepID=A0A8J5LEM6_ZINOF|nr:hypothetical protein ZIOFF_029769 [Zingiber officinale]